MRKFRGFDNIYLAEFLGFGALSEHLLRCAEPAVLKSVLPGKSYQSTVSCLQVMHCAVKNDSNIT